MQDILQRMLRSRNENFTMAATLKDYLRYVGEAILSFTRVGTAQAVWFLLGLDFVSCSRKFISVNTLEKTKLFAAVISNPDELSSLPENSSAIRSPSFNSNMVYVELTRVLANSN